MSEQNVHINAMNILVHDIQAAHQRLSAASRAYVEARAEVRALEAHYTRIVQAAQAAAEAAAQTSESTTE